MGEPTCGYRLTVVLYGIGYESGAIDAQVRRTPGSDSVERAVLKIGKALGRCAARTAT